MKENNPGWHKIANHISEIVFSPNGLTEITVAGKPICLSLHHNTLHACTQKCPHAGGILTEGYLDVHGHIVCPLHGYKFSPKTGRNISGEGFYLKTFPVEIRPDGVFIGMGELGLFGA
jgi:nitrite reductase/ring-hydroxylating ferredoxin subunit